MTPKKGIGLVLAALLLTGCGPALSVVHLDPSSGPLDVEVDDDPVGTIEFGDEIRVSLESGYHSVRVYPAGTTQNPWADDGEGWRFYLDEETRLTLLGPRPDP